MSQRQPLLGESVRTGMAEASYETARVGFRAFSAQGFGRYGGLSASGAVAMHLGGHAHHQRAYSRGAGLRHGEAGSDFGRDML